jgi:hypothetical protein
MDIGVMVSRPHPFGNEVSAALWSLPAPQTKESVSLSRHHPLVCLTPWTLRKPNGLFTSPVLNLSLAVPVPMD